MAFASSSDVTISREYFDTLVRRARFNSDSFENSGFTSNPIVAVPRTEHDKLQTLARKYENLRRNLLNGGVDNDTIELLSQDNTSRTGNNHTAALSTNAQKPERAETVLTAQTTEDGGASLHTYTPQPSAAPFYPLRTTYNGNGNGNGNEHYNRAKVASPRLHERSWADADGEVDEETSCGGDSPGGDVAGANFVKPPMQRPQYDRQCTRTVQLVNLAEGTTHADITAAVRGGMLLDIYLRTHDRSASVSFLHAINARNFFDHVRKNDLYIKNKRVEVKWHDRQFTLPGHVASKIATGATRNLIIRRYDNRHTDENIREDLEHIHNLVVVKTEFTGGNCYLSLNSVHNAIYARSCMMSRGKYKGTKIEWDVDECAESYVVSAPKPRKEPVPVRKVSAPVSNRFQLLNLEDNDEDEITSAFRAERSVGIAA